MGKRLKFCLSERLQTIQEKIAREILPYVDLEWDETESEDNNKNKIREFSTQIDNIKMVVREDSITFTYVNHNDPDGDYTHTKNIEHKLTNGDKVKSIVYKMLCDSIDNDNDVIKMNRRRQIATLAAAIALVKPNNAIAAYGTASGAADDVQKAQVTYVTFYGAAEPPATYGKVGGTTENRAKYSFSVPSDWKEEATSKVEKGSAGWDSHWRPRSSKDVRAVCVTLNRAGEDGQEFSLQETTINALAGSDPELQDALLSGNLKSKRSTIDGQEYVTYDIEANPYYGVKATVDGTGRLFAFIIAAPDNVYKKERATYEKMLASFRTYILDTTK